ncbi:MAG: polymerase gamma/tau subunit [Actinomycetota bacterium]|jgi:DNA polymerase-3 subunit gamma/tau
MATQALYRRYRPRRFSEIRGQEHIVRALRNAVMNERAGQAYLFSGPRGTGKTTSARVLAKVLNCERPVEGEPCCECDSCLAVERGTSYDVHELDAASNNGVDAIRDLIEKASLGTPGRHKVYILDEVHMLSKPAEAALLKTLEEPPPHVVFVLATTDPQKVSETIRSRTQHLRFHLLPMDELEQHVRWVASDAGLELSEAAIQSALEQGAGSARDTLSALELAASTGDVDSDAVPYDEFVEALIEHDPGRALTAVAHSVQQGRDPRTLSEDIVRHLRDCFLSLMAPELVALPELKASVVAEQARRLGAARVVRAIERLGQMLVEMRHAPDARLLLDVALVQLTHEAAASDLGSILDRLDRLEKAAQDGGGHPAVAAAPPPPMDPSTGRVQLGGRARRDATAPGGMARPADTRVTAGAPADDSNESARTAPPAARPEPVPAAAPAPAPAPAAERTPAQAPAEHAAPAVAAPDAAARAAAMWSPDIISTLKPLVRAIYSVPRLLGVRDGALTLAAPNDTHRSKCEQHRGDVEAAIARVVGAPVRVTLVLEQGGGSGSDHDGGGAQALGVTERPDVTFVTPDDEIDPRDLVDAPLEAVDSPIERIARHFPGSEVIDEPR